MQTNFVILNLKTHGVVQARSYKRKVNTLLYQGFRYIAVCNIEV